jgi:hypothetical protein
VLVSWLSRFESRRNHHSPADVNSGSRLERPTMVAWHRKTPQAWGGQAAIPTKQLMQLQAQLGGRSRHVISRKTCTVRALRWLGGGERIWTGSAGRRKHIAPVDRASTARQPWKESAMRRTLIMLALTAGAKALVCLPAFAQSGPEVTLTRFEGGTPQIPIEVNTRFSDIYAYPGLKL